MGFLDVFEDIYDAGGSIVRGGARAVSGAARRTGRITAAGMRGWGDVLGASGDMYTAVRESEDPEAFFATVGAIAESRGGSLLGNVAGPKGIFGEVIEGIPESTRRTLGSGIEKYDDAYRAVARVPASLVATLNILNDAAWETEYTEEGGIRRANPQFDTGIKGLADPDVWRAAWEATNPEDMTVGQAVSFTLADVDILDEAEQTHYEGTRWHQIVSGSVDLTAIMALDPAILLGKTAAVVRGAGHIGQFMSGLGLAGRGMRVSPAVRAGSATDRLIVRPALRRRFGAGWRDVSGTVTEEVGGAMFRAEMSLHELALAGGREGIRNRLLTQIARRENYFTANRGFAAVAEEVTAAYDKAGGSVETAAAMIREALFPRHAHGSQISQLLTRALNGHIPSASGASNYELGENIMRFFLGDNTAIAGIANHSEEAASYLRGMFVRNATVSPGIVPGQVGAHANQFILAQEMSAPLGVGEMVGGFGQLDRLVAPSAYTNIRTGIQQTGWYRSSVTGAPVRWVFDRKAHNRVLFTAADSDVQVTRMAEAAGRSPDEVAEIRGRWMAADEAGRREMFPELVSESIEFVVRRHFDNLTDDQIKELVRKLTDDYGRSVGAATESLTAGGAARGFGVVDEAGETATMYERTMTPEQLRDQGLIPDLWRLNTVARRASGWSASAGAAIGGKAPKAVEGFWAGKQFIDNAFTVMTSTWKPLVLLNPKWPIRVVAMDEQARIAAVLGGTDTLFAALTTGRRSLLDAALVEKLGGETAVMARNEISGILGYLRAAPSRLAVAGTAGGLLAGPVGLAVGVTWSAVRNRRAVARLSGVAAARRSAVDLLVAGDPAGSRAVMEGAGFENLTVLGSDVRAAMGTPAEPLLEWEAANGSGTGIRHLLGMQGDQFADDAIKAFGDWNQIVVPPAVIDDAAAVSEYAQWWERIVNDQLGRSGFARKFFDDAWSNDDIFHWLMLEDEGRATLGEMGRVGESEGEIRQWIEATRDYTERLIPSGVPELAPIRAAQAEGVRLELRQVQDALPDSWNTVLGSVHAQEALGWTSAFRSHFEKLISRGMHRLAELPTNELSRHPFFAEIYEAEMRGRLEMLHTGSLGEAARASQRHTIATLDGWVADAEDAADSIHLLTARSTNAAPNVSYPVYQSSQTAAASLDEAVGPLSLFGDDVAVTSNRANNLGWTDWSNPSGPTIGGGNPIDETVNMVWSGQGSPVVVDVGQPLVVGGVRSTTGNRVLRAAADKKKELEALLAKGHFATAEAEAVARAQVKSLEGVMIALSGQGDVVLLGPDGVWGDYLNGLFPKGKPPRNVTPQEIADTLFGSGADALAHTNPVTSHQTHVWLDPDNLSGERLTILKPSTDVDALRAARDQEVAVAAGAATVDEGMLVGSQGDYRFSAEAIEAMETSSRITALNSVKWLLYDLAEQTHIAESMRHVIPFFNAWQEVLSRWAGLSVRNPAFMARATLAYRELPVVEDDNGREHIVMPIPDFAKDLINSSPIFNNALETIETLQFNKASINMITNLMPGSAPWVTVTASEVVKRAPETEEALDLLFPFGITSSADGSISSVYQVTRAFAPAWARALVAATTSAFADPWDDRTAASAMRTVATAWLVQMDNGDRPMLDFTDANQLEEFHKDVVNAARSNLILLTLTKAFSPLSAKFVSPFQNQQDTWRRMSLENPETADEDFMAYLAEEGIDGFFALSQRSTRSNTGLPPTLAAHEAQERYGDLFKQYPELGGLILGFEGGGAARFSAAVYENSLVTETYSGSGVMQRERMAFSEWVTDTRVRAGWHAYRELNDIVYAQMESMGLPNLRIADAEPLKIFRQNGIDRLEEEYPLWFDDFRDRDAGWEDKFEGLRVLIDDERFSDRTDIQLVGEYFDERDRVTSMLAAARVGGGSVRLDSGSNKPIRDYWEGWIDSMLTNPTFSDVFYRWLEFDSLASETWPEQQQEMIGN